MFYSLCLTGRTSNNVVSGGLACQNLPNVCCEIQAFCFLEVLETLNPCWFKNSTMRSIVACGNSTALWPANDETSSPLLIMVNIACWIAIETGCANNDYSASLFLPATRAQYLSNWPWIWSYTWCFHHFIFPFSRYPKNWFLFRVAEPLRLGILSIASDPKRVAYAVRLNYSELSWLFIASWNK